MAAAEEYFQKLINLEFEIRRQVERLRDCTGEEQEAHALGNDIRVNFRKLGKLIEDTKQVAEEQDKDEDMQSIMRKMEPRELEYDNLTTLLRKAKAQYKVNRQKQEVLEREQLLAGGEELMRKRREQIQKDKVLASQEVVHGLRRTRQMMANELERTSATLKVLEDSSKTIKETKKEYKTFGAVLRTGRGTITKLFRRNKTDQILITIGVLLFVTVVIYILKRRLSYLVGGSSTTE
eukprot:GFYU01008071.1.p1 GENE.GFYU01008071.1~~GFYU01008071.1.p1  ORF type:complete len:236 (+),score=48.32 GFYU01008071.1:118-825(+)